MAFHTDLIDLTNTITFERWGVAADKFVGRHEGFEMFVEPDHDGRVEFFVVAVYNRETGRKREGRVMTDVAEFVDVHPSVEKAWIRRAQTVAIEWMVAPWA